MAGEMLLVERGGLIAEVSKHAQLAYKTYASRSSLKVIDVVFVVDKTESSALVSSRQYNAMDRYEFHVRELGVAAAAW